MHVLLFNKQLIHYLLTHVGNGSDQLPCTRYFLQLTTLRLNPSSQKCSAIGPTLLDVTGTPGVSQMVVVILNIINIRELWPRKVEFTHVHSKTVMNTMSHLLFGNALTEMQPYCTIFLSYMVFMRSPWILRTHT